MQLGQDLTICYYNSVMKLKNNIFKNTSIHFFGKVISLVLNVVFFALIARYLGKAGFGEFTIVMAYLQVFSIFSDWGLYMIFVQMLSQEKYKPEKLMANFLSLRIIISVFVLAIGVLIAFLIPHYSEIIKLGILIVSVSFIFSSIIQLFTGFFQNKMKMENVAISEVVGKIFVLGGAFLSIQMDLGILYILISVVLGSFISFLILFLLLQKYIKFNFYFDFSLYKKIFKKTWPVGLSIILTTIYFKGDTLILSFFKPTFEVGIYGAAYRVLEVLIMFPPIFMGLVLPHMTRALTKKSFERFKNIFQKSFDFFIVLTIPLIVGTFLLSYKIMDFIAGDEFRIAGGPLKILIIATCLIFFSNLGTYTIIALEKQKQMLKFYIFAVFMAMLGYFLLIPGSSYWGAALVTVLVELFIAISSFFVIWKNIKLNLDFNILKKSFISAFVMGIIGFFIKDVHVLLSVFILIIIYFSCLYIFKGLSKEDIKNIILN